MDFFAFDDTDLLFQNFKGVELGHFGKEKSDFLALIWFNVVYISIVKTDFILYLDTDVVSVWKVHDIFVLFDAFDDIFAANVQSTDVTRTIDDFIVLKRERFADFFGHSIASDEQNWVI